MSEAKKVFQSGDRVYCSAPDLPNDWRTKRPGIVIKDSKNHPDEIGVQYGPWDVCLLRYEKIEHLTKTDDPWTYGQTYIDVYPTLCRSPTP